MGYTNFPEYYGVCNVWDTFRVPVGYGNQTALNN